MEPGRMERAGDPGADKVRVDRIVRRRDKVKEAADVARVQGAAGAAVRAGAKVVAVAADAGGIADASTAGVLFVVIT